MYKCSYVLQSTHTFLRMLPLFLMSVHSSGHNVICICSYPPIPPNVIYVNVGAFLLCGFLLSAKVRKKEIALMYAGQLLYFSYNMYSNQSLGYTNWQRVCAILYCYSVLKYCLYKLQTCSLTLFYVACEA